MIKELVKNSTILRMLFYRDIKKGDLFLFDDCENSIKNPFRKKFASVEVKDVKDGYVNYKFYDSEFFQDESMSLIIFLSMYIPVNTKTHSKVSK